MTEREWTNVSQEITCEVCGTTVPRKINTQRFCSDSCRVEYWGEKIEANCIVCNDKFLKPRRKPTQTCSQFCMEVFISVVEATVWRIVPKINHDRKKMVGFNWGPYQEK